MASSVEALNVDLEAQKKAALQAYRAYAASKVGIPLPVAKFSFEREANRMAVHGDITYKGTSLHFEAIQPKDSDDVYNYLDSQPLVREQFGNGKIQSREVSDERVQILSKRFNLSPDGKAEDPDLYLYSAFVVSDEETNRFLGLVYLYGGTKAGEAEMARLNRVNTWSHRLAAVVSDYAEVDKKAVKEKEYQGIGTAETCAILTYAKELKQKDIKVKNEPLTAVVSTARVSNKGSWMSNAQAGMEAYDVDIRKEYGPDLRYHLRKPIL